MPIRTIQPILLAALLLILFGISLYGLQRDSLWLDESWSAWIVYDAPEELDSLSETGRYLRDSVFSTVQHVRDDMHPPLYFLLLEGWTLLLGESEFALRLISALAGLLALAATYAIGRQWMGWKAGIFALLMLGTAGFFLVYTREARMYALLLAFYTMATWVYGLWWRKATLWRGLLYAALLTLALYTHYLAALLILIHGLHHLLTRPGWQFILPYLFTLVLFAPWLPIFLEQVQAHSGASMGAYLPGDRNTVAGFWLIFSSGYGYVFLLPFVLVIARAIYTNYRMRRGDSTNRPYIFLLLLWLLIPLVVLLLLNAPNRTLLQLRYLLLSLPAWALLIGFALAKIRVPYLPWVLLAWILFTQLSMVDDLWQAKPRWRDAVQQAATLRQSDEPALVHLIPQSPAAYYDRQFVLRRGISLDVGWRSFSPQEARDAADTLQNAESVWAFLPAQEPSSWDALAALTQSHGVGYRDSVQGMLFYRLDVDSSEAFSFTFGDLLAYEGEILTPITLTSGELCTTIALSALETVPHSYNLGLYLTRGYNEVLAQADIPLQSAQAGESIEQEICLPLPVSLPPDELHVRLAVYDRASLQRLPLLEASLLWGDFLIVGSVR